MSRVDPSWRPDRPLPLVRWGALLGATLLLACTAAEPESVSPDGASEIPSRPAEPLDLAALAGREIHEPQLVVEADGTLVLLWRETGAEGYDLWSVHREPDGRLSPPARINDQPGTLYSYPHDEMRPGVAAGPGGRIGVVWTDARAQIRGAVSGDHGTTWSPSVRLDQAEEPAYRSFTAAGLGADGALHAVWIDSRLAPQRGAEEPADLFYARLLGEEVVEVNLTADQEPSVCGCCKPDLQILDDGTVRAVFRNTTADGYRDIFTISGRLGAGFGTAKRVGPPLWKLDGCPMSGPLGVGDEIVWPDASSRHKILVSGRVAAAESAPLFAGAASDEWTPLYSPRRVAGTDEVSPLLLLPGRPESRFASRAGGSWAFETVALPSWATSAARVGEGYLVVGAVDGELLQRVLPTLH